MVPPNVGSVRIRPLESDDAQPLGQLFAELRDDRESAHFHPHPFTADEARRIAERRGVHEDLYFGAFLDDHLIGYGMLRGWDEGYVIPSFGVAVGIAHRGLGVGRLLLRYAISVAKRRGAPTMMLKVHPDNSGAKHLYESEGFTFDPVPVDGGQLKGLLALQV